MRAQRENVILKEQENEKRYTEILAPGLELTSALFVDKSG